jgi:peptide/nickel transport system substrate-binding protein
VDSRASRPVHRQGVGLADVRLSRRKFLVAAGAAGGSWLLAACTFGGGGSDAASGSSTPVTETRGRFKLGKLEQGKIVTDESLIPTSFQEAPELAELVKAGSLPSIEERIGRYPVVLQPVHEVGRYSTKDMMRHGMVSQDVADWERLFVGPDSLNWFNEWGDPESVVPNVARSFDWPDDRLTLTFQLREGMRWSDGEPLTTDDVIFAWEDIQTDPIFGIWPDPGLQVNGKTPVLEKLDDYTFRFTLPEAPPDNSLSFSPATWANYPGEWAQYAEAAFAPKHYLQQFHPKYIGEDQATKLAKDAGFNDWAAYFLNRSSCILNAELPVTMPWKVKAGSEFNTTHFALERNPYSIWVDTAGNQLPYIGTIEYDIQDSTETLILNAIAGDYDFQNRGLEEPKLPLLVQNQQQGGYKVYLDPTQEVDFGVRINLSYMEDPEIGDLFRTADFRRALSMGIDRDQLNEAFFLGVGVPSAALPQPGNRYDPGDEYRTMWATLDVDKANELLDGLGLEMGDDGFRQRRDGKGHLRLRYSGAVTGAGEMIQRQWRRIGIDLDVQELGSTLLQQRAAANQIQLFGHILYVSDLFTLPYSAFPSDNYDFYEMNGVLYADWFISKGKKGLEPFPELKELMDLYNQGYIASTDDQVAIGKEFWRKYADTCLQIGCVAQTVAVLGIHLAKTNMGNIPERVENSADSEPMLNGWPQMFYYKD